MSAAAILFFCIAQCGVAQAAAQSNQITQLPAVATPAASSAMMLGVTRAGNRIVAVGDHGIVLLSDDDGKTFRQARAVPRRVTLTSVSFIDAKSGWASGHGGTILHTTDGGETWVVQREDYSVDQPLFTIKFVDANIGVAAGLWSLLLRTEDGGRTWKTLTLPPAAASAKADYNLFCIFEGNDKKLFMTAERGTVYESDDAGINWHSLPSKARATLWTGLKLRSGVLLVAGVQGRMLRSSDAGATWNEVASGSRNSITAIAQLADGSVFAVGLDGGVSSSRDDGLTFLSHQLVDRSAITSLIAPSAGAQILFTENGVTGR